MNITKTILNILTLTSLLLASVSAKSLTVSPDQTNLTAGLSINIIQQNQQQIQGRLINADESYFVFENEADASIQLIARGDVSVLETNIDINIFNLMKSNDPNVLSDEIELNDGSKIPSIILDITKDGIQYFAGKSLRRQFIPSDNIYAIHLDSDSVEVPFPMVAAYTPTL